MLGPEYADFELGGAPGRLALLASLRRLRAALAGKVRATLRAEGKDRVREWHGWLEESWSSDQGAVYRWLKDESYAPPVTFLTRPDDTATANQAETHGLLQDAWRLINRKYASDPELDPATFARQYGHHVRRVPMIASRLDGPRLHKGLSRMKRSASGLDGWSLADIRSLPDRLLGWLADLLRAVERLGTWSTRLAKGYTALIPKEGPPGPLNTRPLTVLSMVYQLWTGVRLVDAIAWQEALAHPAAFGFVPGQERPGRGGGDTGPLGAVSPPGVGLRGDEHRLRQVFPSHPSGGRAGPAVGAGHGPGHVSCLRGHVQAAPPGLQDRRGFRPMVANYQQHPLGVPLSVILVNPLTTIWKWEVDSLRRQVCAKTAALPPALDEDAADDPEPGALLPLKDAGPGYTAPGSSGYADDTQAVALGAAALQDTVPATE